MSLESPTSDPWTSPTDTGARSDLECIAAASVRELQRMEVELASLQVGTGRTCLSPRYWVSLLLGKKLRRISEKLGHLRARLGAVTRDPNHVPRPMGAGPGIFPRASDQPVTVLIPVFDAFDAFQSCLAAAIRFTSSKHRILVLDDGGKDPRVGELAMAMAAAHANVGYHRHQQNQGYTRNVNYGALVATGDIVLLNSDARVTPGWLTALRETAHAAKDIATVTPLSNAAGAFSVPENNVVNDIVPPLGLSDHCQLLAEIGAGQVPAVPTGNGFCLYIRRDAIAALGYFDAQLFPVGYGEENDFCQRAVLAGWRNVIDARVYVYHRRTASFGDRKAALLAHGAAELKKLHPNYDRDVGTWLKHDSLAPLRAIMSERLTRLANERRAAARCDDARPTIMLVVFAGGGGTPKTNLDLARGLGSAWRVLVLTMSPDEWLLAQVDKDAATVLEQVFFPSLVGIGDNLPTAHDETLRHWIAKHKVRVVHFRHWLGTAPEIVRSASEAGAKVIVSLHDFYSVCPVLSLVDASGSCCFGDCEAHAQAIAPLGDCKAVESWPGQAAGVTLWKTGVKAWRTRVRESLQSADALITTATSAQDIIARTQPEIAAQVRIIEHGRDFAHPAKAASFHAARLVFLGEGTFVKGADFFIALARAAHECGATWEFHLLGKAFIEVPVLPNLKAHGGYDRDTLADKLIALQPTLILLPSRFPETYCHTLTEAWSCGIPVLAHGIGALRERIETHGGGWLLPSLETTAWLAQLQSILASERDWSLRRDEACARAYRDVSAMTQDYLDLYASIIGA